jgi:hypothetical protein
VKAELLRAIRRRAKKAQDSAERGPETAAYLASIPASNGRVWVSFGLAAAHGEGEADAWELFLAAAEGGEEDIKTVALDLLLQVPEDAEIEEEVERSRAEGYRRACADMQQLYGRYEP